jgi:hypothetical protein
MPRASERRSSKPQTGSASITGSSPTFAPSAEGWKTIEFAYGRKLNEDYRSEVCTIVNKYLFHRRFEKASPLVSDVLAHIKQIEKVARRVNRVLPTVLSDDGPQAEAKYQAQIAIEREWRGVDYLGPDKLTRFYSLSLSLVLASIRARKAAGGGTKEGRAWDEMACGLMQFARTRDLPHKVRKDPDKQAELKPSPFVAFVAAIEEQYPRDVPARSTTSEGLAKAITTATKALRQKSGRDSGWGQRKQIPPAG